MGNAKNTLRSQTVRCPHCGEYYSVTYKYCPFCDAGRQEEERKQAEKKKQKQAFFSNLFGGQEPEKKPKKPVPPSSDKEERPKRPQREHPDREAPVDRARSERDSAGRSRGERSRTTRELSREASPPDRGHTERDRGNKERVVREPKEHVKPKEHGNKEPKEPVDKVPKERVTKESKERVSKEPKEPTKEPAMEPAQETLRNPHHHGHRKKTSEMTPEEKAASLADREARAAARKRERDRLAREAALAEVQATPSQEKADAGLTEQPAPVETGPVFEDVTVPETFGLMEELPAQPQAAVFVGDGTGEENLIEVPTVPENMEEAQGEQIPEVPEVPVVSAAPVGSDAAVVPSSAETTVEEEPTWETIRDLGVLAPAIEAALQGESGKEGNQESGNGQVGQPVQEETPVVQPEASEGAAEPAEDLDTLLSEIRDLLEESPVPALSAEQLQKPVVPEQAVQLQEELEPADSDGASDPPIEPEAQEDPETPQTEPEVPAAEETEEEDLPQVDEPTISMGPLLSREGETALEETESAPTELVADDAPTQVIPSQEIKEELRAQEENANEADSQEKEPKERKKSKRILMIASLLVVVLAIFIVGRKVVPMLQNGISQTTTQAAESVTLDKTTLDLAEAGTTMTLVPTVAPEGAKASFTWASSVPTVATVDEKGTVTAVAPGTTVISVVIENGQKAECTVNCTWNGEAGQPPAAPGGPDLSAKDITLDKAGATKQITMKGTEEQITWSSSDPAVASVSPDGTVTAVNIGQAIVSAKVGEETLNCTVRCVW